MAFSTAARTTPAPARPVALAGGGLPVRRRLPVAARRGSPARAPGRRASPPFAARRGAVVASSDSGSSTSAAGPTSAGPASSAPPPASSDDPTRISVDDVLRDSSSLPSNFCIIEGGARDGAVRDFADMTGDELMRNIESRKNKVFIMLEEVRRLRVQAQLREKSADSEIPRPAREYPSVVPGFPRLTENTFNDYYIYWGGCVAFMLLFGGLFAPLAEVKLGLGGTIYMDFIESVNLPRQLAMVDPIVASFTGGAVGAISAFFAIEINNFKEQEKKLCLYCKGSGYLTCAECCTSDRPGRIVDPKSGAKSFCGCCSGTGKVMCTSCLCTGVAMVTEHDPRIDPFD